MAADDQTFECFSVREVRILRAVWARLVQDDEAVELLAAASETTTEEVHLLEDRVVRIASRTEVRLLAG